MAMVVGRVEGDAVLPQQLLVDADEHGVVLGQVPLKSRITARVGRIRPWSRGRGRARACRRTGPGGAGRGTGRARAPAPPRSARPHADRRHRPADPRSNATRSDGPTSHPVRPSSIWSWIPPTCDATTGRPFHIASATVRPKPSARLFCTTTSARRCGALTITAFSSASSIGSSARWTPAHGARQVVPDLDLREHLGALGIVRDGGHVRSRQHEVRVLLLEVDVLREAGQHAERVLEPVPAGHLGHDRRVEPRRAPRSCGPSASPGPSCRRAARTPPCCGEGGPRQGRRRAAPRSRS